MTKRTTTLVIAALVTASSGCFFASFKRLVLPGYEKGIADSAGNFDKLEAAAKAEGWSYKRKPAGAWNNDFDFVASPQSGKQVIFQGDSIKRILAFNCKGMGGDECKANTNKLLVRAFGVSMK